MTLIRPRLTDYYNIAVTQENVNFAIPFLDEDIPFCLDPFLLWRSPSMQDNSLHGAIINSFNYLGYLVNKGKEIEASEILIKASECEEVGLGFSIARQGHHIGNKTASQILSLFSAIPHINKNGFTHFEEIQLFVDQISKDRISDISCNYLKSWLIDFTIDQCNKLAIPMQDVLVENVYDLKANKFTTENTQLPVNPLNGKPVVLVPKRWLRRAPWICYDEYFKDYYLKEVSAGDQKKERIEILNFNRHNYEIVQLYVKQKEMQERDCRNDPLFVPIPVLSARRKLDAIKKLPSGKTHNADKKYEDLICQLYASLLYPYLDFADSQVRTDSGRQIRDLIFYNTRSMTFLSDIYESYGSRQIVFEIKNVHSIERQHINQLNRYLGSDFGKFGIFITRNPLTKPMKKNTIDLWSGQRCCIIDINDHDLELMVNVFESKQRLPIEVINKKYVEFMRACPV